MYLIPSEIFPMIIRSFGMSFSISGQFVITAVLLTAAPVAFQNIGYKFWIVLICCTVFYLGFTYFLLPEVNYTCSAQSFTDHEQTKGMTLEDISTLFGDPVELKFEEALERERGGDTDQSVGDPSITSATRKPTNDHVEKI